MMAHFPSFHWLLNLFFLAKVLAVSLLFKMLTVTTKLVVNQVMAVTVKD